ncbi:MAG TPA: ISKra4 family transposase [Candidatus Sulfotelmatobacter sp.]|nr:ISKra4 family transposase [Candidatus Sulfotelmatobacter sp.]
MAGRVHQSVCAADEDLGHMEEELLHGSQELLRQTLEKAAQHKAEGAPPHCPVCHNKLGRLTQGHWTTIQSRFGAIRVQRTRGWCRRCRRWRYPADQVLGLPEEGTQSPVVQELAALTVSKMPAPEAERVIERLTGVKISAATLGRQARQQGKRAQQKRQSLDHQMSQPEGQAHQDKDLQGALGPEPFTMVIQLDAWNIRERDDWGQSQAMRQAGQTPERWHWVYGGTCFRLSQRVQTTGQRSVILSRGYVMTRQGTDALKEQLWAEAMRRGLGKARDVLVIADGAVWIWNLAQDRFQGARQRVDFYHVSQHLWAVAHALYPEEAAAARAWVEPLLSQLKAEGGCPVITELAQLRERLAGTAREQLDKELNYLQSHRERMDYGVAQQQDEPLGSGAMESTCRQYQTRFKRTGQFWTPCGDEALLCVETFWRNDRWHLLFPHVKLSDLSKN